MRTMGRWKGIDNAKFYSVSRKLERPCEVKIRHGQHFFLPNNTDMVARE